MRSGWHLICSAWVVERDRILTEEVQMRVLKVTTVIAGLTLLAAVPGYAQTTTKPPEAKPGQTYSQPAAKPAPKGIEKIESTEQLGAWRGSQIIGAKVEDSAGKNIGKIED